MVESPCKGVCKLIDEVCTGCRRTTDEVVGWYDMSNEDKQKVIDRLNELHTISYTNTELHRKHI
jgi:predicted Fe-S protein YdhL (DUF1289 family)